MNDGTPALDPTAFYVPPRGDLSWMEERSVSEPLFTPPNPGGAQDATQIQAGGLPAIDTGALASQFNDIVLRDYISWEVEYQLVKRLGSGGQGIVFLADRRGAFGVSFRLALKFFQPANYPDVDAYREEMARLARLSMKLARLQQDHLVDVYNVLEYRGIQTLVMEWVDGYDLRFLLTPGALEYVRKNSDHDTWQYVNDVIVTNSGPQLRLKPGVAIAILRDCLSAVAALHREDILHADIKPANIMVKRTGNCKIVDFGSAFVADEPPHRPTWTPRYAAVEVLEGSVPTPASDLASLGYVLMEMLSGQPCFSEFTDIGDYAGLVAAKRQLPDTLYSQLPADVVRNTTLIDLLQQLIAPEPSNRFASAEAADMSEEGGAAEFQRQLVRGDLASEYENDLRLWLEELA
ncbi:MAG: serine/threonine protein kinase [Planctomycetaceae bacterium]|nr:serine/threonine protein kinase [Planctomycetaceae bacterium]